MREWEGRATGRAGAPRLGASTEWSDRRAASASLWVSKASETRAAVGAIWRQSAHHPSARMRSTRHTPGRRRDRGCEGALSVGGFGSRSKTDGELTRGGPCEITVDSGAEECMWKKGWLEQEPTRTTGVSPKRFVAANGQEMPQYGCHQVNFNRKGDDGLRVMSLSFEVTDVTRPVVAVRIVESGNVTHFDVHGSWITNRAKGDSMPLDRKSGCYCVMGRCQEGQLRQEKKDIDVLPEVSVDSGQ